MGTNILEDCCLHLQDKANYSEGEAVGSSMFIDKVGPSDEKNVILN
jgi:hypothetical protein